MIFLSIDYQEFRPETYGGVVVSVADRNIKRFCSGDVKSDLRSAEAYAKKINLKVLYSSSVENYFIDKSL